MDATPAGAPRAHALSRDAALVCVAGALRAAAVSTVGIIIALYLARSGFFQRYGTSEVQLAWLFFAARILNGLSHFAAAWVARRVGLLNTMVFTHLPSSIFLMLAPRAPTASIAAALLRAREALVEMDVPTRQSYVMAVVPRSSRTCFESARMTPLNRSSNASGMTNVTRNASWAVGPLVGGMAMQHLALAAPAAHRRHTEDLL